MLFLSPSEVEELLDLDELVEALAGAHAELSAGRVSMPPAASRFATLAGLDPAGLVELGELVSGLRTGRTAREQITLYKSVGVAVQDAAAAALVLAAARERDVGRWIELEELRT